MSRILGRVVLATCGLAAVAASSTCEAQISCVRRGGLLLGGPYIPSISIGVRAGIPPLPLVRPYLLPRRRPWGLLGPPPALAGAPSQVDGRGPGPEAPRYVPGATNVAVNAGYPMAASASGFPTAEEFAALDDAALLNAVVDIAAQLDADLGRFNTGAGWQDYLHLPADALPPAAADGRVVLGYRSLVATLERLNSVAAEPGYSMISSVPSFIAMQAALAEVTGRFNPDANRPNASSQAAAASTSQTATSQTNVLSGERHEELPTPPPMLAAPENAPAGERSILAR